VSDILREKLVAGHEATYTELSSESRRALREHLAELGDGRLGRYTGSDMLGSRLSESDLLADVVSDLPVARTPPSGFA
jgi:hypothetical protein